MRIAFVLNGFPELSETFILNQIVGVRQRGHAVDLFADRPATPAAKLPAEVERFGLLERTRYRVSVPERKLARFRSGAALLRRWGLRQPARVLDSLNPLRYGGKALNLRKLHERFCFAPGGGQYDVIHCQFGPNGEQAIDLRQMGVFAGPILTTFHGYDVNRLPRIHGANLYRRLFREGDQFTVGSEFMRQRICALGAPPERVVKLPMGVEVARFPLPERSAAPGERFELFTVARLVEVKGIEYALRALAILNREGKPWRYRIAGDGPLRPALEVLARELGLGTKVEFLGALAQEELRPLYAQAQVFVLPGVVSREGDEEGQSVVLLEAQASGLPVIASRVGGMPETMLDGVSGLLVPPRDPEALAAALRQLAGDPDRCRRMGLAGRRHVEQHFDLAPLHDQLVDLYQSMQPGIGGSSLPAAGQ